MLTPNQRRLQQAEALTRRLIGDVAVEAETQHRAIRLALGEVLDLCLEDMPEDARAELFALLEARASTRQRRLIAAHPMRPDMDSSVTDSAGTGEPDAPATPETAPAAPIPTPPATTPKAANSSGPEGTAPAA